MRAVAGKRGGIVRVARGVANKQLLSLHVMRQKENSQRLKEKQTLKAKNKNEKEKRKEFSTEMGFTSLCILNLKNADKLVCAVRGGDVGGGGERFQQHIKYAVENSCTAFRQHKQIA